MTPTERQEQANETPCQIDGCEKPGEEYWFDVDTSAGFYCADHALQEGFCLGCAYFWSGNESFDFSPMPGFCYDCRTELESRDREEIEDEGSFFPL